MVSPRQNEPSSPFDDILGNVVPIVVFVFLLLCSVLPAADPEWTYISSPHFELYTSAGPGDAKKTIQYFEQVRDFFMRAKASDLTPQVPATIVAFKNRTQYTPYAINEAAAAYYVGDHDRDYIVMSGTGPDQFPIAVHEFIHLLIRHSDMTLPLWLNEGLAELYSTLRPHGGKILVGSVPVGRARVLKSERWMPLEKLLTVNHDSPEYNERDRAGIFYSQSWLLVHMLMLDDYTREGFPQFLKLVSSGKSAAEAFEEVWKLPVEYMDKKLQGYSRYQSFNGLWYDVKMQKFDQLEPQPAGPVDVEMTLATLAGFLGRSRESVDRLEALAQKHPDNWKIQEALAVLAWRRSNLAAARLHFRRATELHSPNWKTWFDYARLIHGMPDDYETAINVLRRTIELNGSLVEARVMLAEEYNYAKRYKDTLATIARTQRVTGALAGRLFAELAFAHAQLGNEEQALKAIARAKEFASEIALERRIESIERYLDVRTRPQIVAAPQAPVPVPAPGAAPVPPPPSAPARPSVSGVFQELECLGTHARMKIATKTGIVHLLIRDPSRITIRGSQASMNLSCGTQPKGRNITVQYNPNEDKSAGTKGDVRILEFH